MEDENNALKIICKNAIEVFKKDINVKKRQNKDADLGPEGKLLQRESQTEVIEGRQRLLPWKDLPEKEQRRQDKNYRLRVLKREANYSKNFYVLDTETNGFKHNEPI